MTTEVATIERFLRLLHEPGSVFEIRIPNTARAGTVSGYFDDSAKAATAIAKWDGRAPGVYTTLNPVKPALLARAANRLRERARDTTIDDDILRRHWLLIDVDVQRPAGISATDDEFGAAAECAYRVKAYLEGERSWPAGLLGDSGNGGHLLYRVDLPNDPESRDLLKRLLTSLAARFDDSADGGVRIDVSVFNAARIAKVLGTMACKGDSLPERPHRRSGVESAPDTFAVVPLSALLAEAGPPPAPRAGGGNGRGEFDLEAFLASNHLEVRKRKSDRGGDVWELAICPFNGEHDHGEAFVRRDADGTISAGCQHQSCFKSWEELRERFEPGHRERQKAGMGTYSPAEAATRKSAAESCTPAPQTAPKQALEPPTLAACDDILERFVDALHDAGVVGEDRFAKVLYLAITTRVLKRIVSVCVKGVSAAGKSWVLERVLAFFPASAYHVLTSMSEHGLAYVTEPLSHRMLVVYEAAGLESEFASYLARSLLSEGCIRYLTVEKAKGGAMVPREIVIEGPTGLIETTTRVNLHPENETRLLSIVANDTAAQTKAVLLRTALDDDDPPAVPEPWPALQEWVGQGEHRVAIPYSMMLADQIPPVAVRLRRDFSTILSLIKAHAILQQCHRERDEHGRIVATRGDYAVVRELVGDLIGDEVEATVSATTRETVAAVVAVQAEKERAVTFADLAERLGLDKSAARRRAKVAIAANYLRNDEDRRGKPARLMPADALPEDLRLLPLPEQLESGGTVAQAQGGYRETPQRCARNTCDRTLWRKTPYHPLQTTCHHATTPHA